MNHQPMYTINASSIHGDVVLSEHDSEESVARAVANGELECDVCSCGGGYVTLCDRDYESGDWALMLIALRAERNNHPKHSAEWNRCSNMIDAVIREVDL